MPISGGNIIKLLEVDTKKKAAIILFDAKTRLKYKFTDKITEENIHVFIEHIFNHLINPKTPNYIYENAYKSFNIFINYLNYPFE